MHLCNLEILILQLSLKQSIDIRTINAPVENVFGENRTRAVENRAQMKIDFDAKFKETMEKKTGKNVKILDEAKYREKLERIEQMRKKDGYKWIPEDYALLKAHQVVETINTDGSITQTLVKVDPRTGSNKQYVTIEKLFDVIHAEHTKKVKHSGRLLTYKELNLWCANITMEQIVCFIDLCNTCAANKQRQKRQNY